MKKSLKILLMIACVWGCIFLIDFACVKMINRPIFMIRTSIYKDGGTKVYHGLGYKVIKCAYNKKITIGTYSLKYNCKVDIIENTSLVDSVKFSNEYDKVPVNNPFVYRNMEEIIKVLENGTGIVYLGFPECKWCQAYVPYLNEVSIENNLEKIYYYNILEDRKNNTDDYKKIVSILKEYLRYDEEGNKRIYVPSVIAIKEGTIVGFDDETSYDTKGFSEPSDYWNDKTVSKLKAKLDKMIKNVNNLTCTECNKD